MEISVRSYLTAGTVAVVGAGAIALTPALPVRTADLPAPTVAQIALTGDSFSLNDVLGVIQDLGGVTGLPSAILSALQDLGGLSVPGISGLPSDLLSSIASEFIKQTIPVVLDAAGPFLDYVRTTVTGLLVGPDSIPVKVAAVLPTVAGAVSNALGTGDFGAAIQALTDGLAAPVEAVRQALGEVANQFQAFIGGQLGTIVGALPAVLISAVQKVIGINLSDALDAITTVVQGLLGGALPFSGAPVINGKHAIGYDDAEGTDSQGTDAEGAGSDSEGDDSDHSAAEDADDAPDAAASRGAAKRKAAGAKLAGAVKAPAAADAVVAPEAPVVTEAPAAPEAPGAPEAVEAPAPTLDSVKRAAPAAKPAPRVKQTLRERVAAAKSAAKSRAAAAAAASN